MWCDACSEDREEDPVAPNCCPVCGEGLLQRPGVSETATPPLPEEAAQDDTDPSIPEELQHLGSGREALSWLQQQFEGNPDIAGMMAMAAQGGGLEGAFGAGGEATAAAAQQVAVDKLPRFTVEENSWILFQTSLKLFTKATPQDAVCVDALFADFGTPPAAGPLLAALVLADPPTGHPRYMNGTGEEGKNSLCGCIVVVDRGGSTFATKALEAQKAGAKAVIIVQTVDVWPYVMKDSKGEAAEGGLSIPVCMVDQRVGKLIKAMLKGATEGQGKQLTSASAPAAAAALICEMTVNASEKDCVVCQELFQVGTTVVRLPCGHLYHEDCIIHWLKRRSTCPVCRLELPSQDADAEAARQRRARAREGAEDWNDWFS